MVPAGALRLASRRHATAPGAVRCLVVRNRTPPASTPVFAPGPPESESEIGGECRANGACIALCQDPFAAMNLDDASDDWWPPLRVGESNPRVINGLQAAYHSVTRRLDLATRQHGLEGAEALVLAVVLRDPGCSPGGVRYRLGLHRSALLSNLDRLERDGLIQRLPGTFDGRRFELNLTSAGVTAAELAEFEIGEIEADIAGYSSRAHRAGAQAVFEACVAIARPGRSTRRL